MVGGKKGKEEGEGGEEGRGRVRWAVALCHSLTFIDEWRPH